MTICATSQQNKNIDRHISGDQFTLYWELLDGYRECLSTDAHFNASTAAEPCQI